MGCIHIWGYGVMNVNGKRAVIYARVSTDGQTVDNQLAELQLVAERHGWDVVATYLDEGVAMSIASQTPAAYELRRPPGIPSAR